MAIRADARDHAIMAALTTSAHTAALEAWLCALLSALFGRIEAFRQFFPHEINDLIAEDERQTLRLACHAIRAANRLRARVGWLQRFHPNRAMARTFGHVTPQMRPQPARPPPARATNPPKSVSNTPLPAVMTHARSVNSSAAD